MNIRRADDRGLTTIDWLVSRHTFSFGEYFDPRFLGFRALRVINDDWVAPGKGFGMHGHRDMEIITLVISGALEHKDSLGHQQVLRPGEVQVMSAGTGIRHSEYNHSNQNPVHFLQIWLEPTKKGLPPHYEQRAVPASSYHNRWSQILGPKGSSEHELAINQNALMYRASLESGRDLRYPDAPASATWLHVISGDIQVNGTLLHSGDGMASETEAQFQLTGIAPTTDLLLFLFPV